MVSFQLRTAEASPDDLLDLPWSVPLEDWPATQQVRLPRGIHRHPVLFIKRESGFLALKELPDRLARHEYEMLGRLHEHGLPTIDAVGVASRRTDADGHPIDGILITKHLQYSLPYRNLFQGQAAPDVHEKLIDALVVLLARLHLIGFFWGDCSLNNALFRRDAGALTAWVIDVETSEIHENLTDGQRHFDLDIATENIVGGLFDLQAANRLDAAVDPVDMVESFERRYHDLWAELTGTEVVGSDELWRLHARLARLNELGFDTAEMDLVSDGSGSRIEFRPRVVEAGHHQRELRNLVGIEATENQARRLLSAIGGYRAFRSAKKAREIPLAVAAYEWLTERWDPTMASIPFEFQGRLEAPELYHQILEHNWYLSEQAGHDVGLAEAARSYVSNILCRLPDERTIIDESLTAELQLPDDL